MSLEIHAWRIVRAALAKAAHNARTRRAGTQLVAALPPFVGARTTEVPIHSHTTPVEAS